MAQITRTNSVLISENLTTTSQIIAEKFSKRHDNIVQAIEKLDIPAKYRLLNFQETVTERPNPAGGAPIKSKSYNLTRDGFALLVMGFTGKRALAWKIKFLEAFNGMEARLKSGTIADIDGYRDGLRAMLRLKSLEELAAWAQGDRAKIDKVIDYLEIRLLDDHMAHGAYLEASHILTIAKALRGDTPDTKLIPVRAHLRKTLKGSPS